MQLETSWHALLIFMVSLLLCANVCNANIDTFEYSFLQELYDGTSGNTWLGGSIAGWDFNSDPCTWQGLSCNPTGTHVTMANLTGFGLNGTIPYSIGNLTDIRHVDMSNNSIYGNIPVSICNLTRLEYLNLGMNALSGSIPDVNVPHSYNVTYNTTSLVNVTDNGTTTEQIANVTATNLIETNISHLDIGMLIHLKELYLYSNKLTGQITDTIGSLTNLEILDVSDNYFSGTIPSNIGDMTRLEELHLHSNNLVGSIESNVGQLTNLQNLSLSYNYFVGSIPTTIADLTKLHTLSLHHNQLSGPLHDGLCNLTNLEYLQLHNNGLTGGIPSAIGDLSLMKSLTINHNNLRGIIPASIGDGMKDLNELHLQFNKLHDKIPENLFNLTELRQLMLQSNDLNGTLPSPPNFNASTQVSKLEIFSVQNNFLSGHIPNGFGNLTELKELFINQNNLEGTIPESLGAMTKLQKLYIHNYGLTGVIPMAVRKLYKNLQDLVICPSEYIGGQWHCKTQAPDVCFTNTNYEC